jgi:type I restriction enzyme R subunit
MNNKDLTEHDICTKIINSALQIAGWDMKRQIREEVSFANGRIIFQGKHYTGGKRKRADYIRHHEIVVSKVNSLMALCDDLEKEIETY